MTTSALKMLQVAQADYDSAQKSYMNELERDVERREGSGAQERRREEIQRDLRDRRDESLRNLNVATQNLVGEVIALNGCKESELSEAQLGLLGHAILNNRKYGLSIEMADAANQQRLTAAQSRGEAAKIQSEADRRIAKIGRASCRERV